MGYDFRSVPGCAEPEIRLRATASFFGRFGRYLRRVNLVSWTGRFRCAGGCERGHGPVDERMNSARGY
ncbi:hypothetical protein I547_6458 [Mycobacterium kansasii 824]|nr:hypothetical protein I547_6458 [Mycobacterium kansasii 824]